MSTVIDVICLLLVSRYLVTTMTVVPRGTDGAVSLVGTFAGLIASIFLAFIGYVVALVLL